MRSVRVTSPKLRPNRRLSQVFLQDLGPCRRVCRELKSLGCERVLEIGPGPGILTGALLGSGFKVLAVEKDPRWVGELNKRFAAELADKRLTLINACVLSFALNQVSVDAICGNIPYHLSSAIMSLCLDRLAELKTCILMVQLEFGRRVVASPGGKDYGRLSVYAQLRSTPRALEVVDRKRFFPVPKVDSVLVQLLSHPPISPSKLAAVERVTRTAFSLRRKKLGNSLASLLDADALARLGLDANLRCEQLSVDDFLAIAKTLLDLEPQTIADSPS